ncbi:uncharacterized protein FA14DRAFT_156911 [Meira miltonrushii]|uniref:Uncharacterized protein n=1 Tax=Meira miltonrushii TaxID=1280837 RepID=A0A316VAG7_9BASI|nr:uncharacterized protein FA14DRAFT_156911 [Meira miltonrushii]PWN34244.1 hypothetical protein FA14DRAFT_156911 [Meira miltonrushii]
MSSSMMSLPIGRPPQDTSGPEKSAVRKAASSMLSFLLASPPYLPNDIKSKDVNRRHNLLSLYADDPEDYLVTDCYPSPKGHTPSRAIELLHQLREKVEQMGSSHYTDESSPLLTNVRFRTPESECILAAIDLGEEKEETLLTLIMRLEGDQEDSKDYKFDNLLPSDVVPEGWHESIQKAQEYLEKGKKNHLEVQKARSYSIVTTTSTIGTVDSAYSTASAGHRSEGDEDTSERDESLDNDVSFDDNFVRKGLPQTGINSDIHSPGTHDKEAIRPWPQKTDTENEKGPAEYYTDPKDFWAGTGDDNEDQDGDGDNDDSEHEESEEDRQRREQEEEERYWARYDNQDSGQNNQTGNSNHHDEEQQKADMLAGLVQNFDDFGLKTRNADGFERSQEEEEENHEQSEQRQSIDSDQNAMLINSTDTRYGEDLDEERPIRPKFNKSNSFVASQLEGSDQGQWNEEEELQSDQSERGSNNDHDTVTGHRGRNRSNPSQFDEAGGEQEINQEDALMHMHGGQHSEMEMEPEFMDEGDPQEMDDSIQPLGGYRDRNSNIFSPPSPSLHPSDTFLADNASDASMSVMRSTIQERQKPRSSMLFQLRSSKNNNMGGGNKRNGKESTAMRIEKMRNYRPTREATITTQQAHNESVRIGQRQRDYAVRIKKRNESIKMIIKGAWKLMDDRSSGNNSDDSNGDVGLEMMNENDFLRLAREAVRECVEERRG